MARQRGAELTPEELAGESFDNPDVTPHYLVDVNKLMRAWEEMNGRTALDKRGELRQGCTWTCLVARLNM